MPPCPCGSVHTYLSCCGRFIDEGTPPETAEQLMRSRYTAFTQSNEAYLLASWHANTRPESLDFDAKAAVKWLGLRIDKVESGGVDDDRGLVCFVANSRVGGGRAQRLQECSRFVREQGRWFYVDGDVRAYAVQSF
ncbi:MAG: YchJ family metal-binding protein [Halothiobacillaceae bacterium]|nr:YchJ family metal-binding protein [Halothiobacillaceae bacterium]